MNKPHTTPDDYRNILALSHKESDVNYLHALLQDQFSQLYNDAVLSNCESDRRLMEAIQNITTDMYIRTLSGEQHLFEANLHRGPYSLAKSVACTACGCTNLNIVEDGKYKFTNVCSECSAELSHSIVHSDFPEASFYEHWAWKQKHLYFKAIYGDEWLS